MKTQMKQKGITLIALVITIIVLLILAGITISTLIGENGILTQAREAQEETKLAEIKERVSLKLQEWKKEKYLGDTKFEDFLRANFDSVTNNGDGTYTVTLDGYEVIVDEDGNIIGEIIKTGEIAGTDIYVTLYTDGTLAFSKDETKIEGKTESKSYGNIKGKGEPLPWNDDKSSVISVEFLNEILPVDTSWWFVNCTNLKSINHIENLNTSKVTNMTCMFEFCGNLTNLNVTSFNTNKVTDMSYMFGGCKNLTNLDVSHFSTNNVINMRGMFEDCENLTNLDVSNFDTSKVTDMGSMFYGCKGLTSLDVSNFDTSKVTDMGAMFGDCEGLTSLDLTSFNTSGVTKMEWMFYSCSNLTSIDVSNFDTSKVTDMSLMFQNCENFANLDVSNFDTSKVTNMSSMFYGCKGLTSLDVSNFDTSKVTDMGAMFGDCEGLTSLDLTSFNTSGVTSMRWMFIGCNNLKLIYGRKDRWITTNVTDNARMFDGCGTDHITFMTYMNGNTVVGYEIGKGLGWSGTTTVSRTDNQNRASAIYPIHLDPNKTYTVTMNNNNYNFGIIGIDILSYNKIYDSGWLNPGTQTINGLEWIVLNFKYKPEKTITDDMVTEIIDGLIIQEVS